MAESVQATAEPLCEVRGWNESLPLKPQQWPAVRFGLKHRQTWIGDDMGLGKSPTSLAVVAIDDAYPLVIVCMPSLVGNWAKEVKRFLPLVNVFIAEGQKVKPIPPRTDVVIIGSAALGYAPRVAKGEPKVFPWVQALSRIRPKALILDESQIAKEQSAARTQAIKELAAPIVEADGIALLLTGTAMMNRPKELGPQLEIIGRIDVFGGMGAFLVRYCESERNEFGRKFDGAHNLDELYRILRTEGLMIRRDKSILDLPPCNEIDERIGLDQLDQEIMAEYFEAERDVVNFLGKKAEKIARRFGVNPDDARVRAAMKAQAAEHLVLINTLRGLVGRAKVDYAKRWVADKVARGEKVMVAAHHQEVTGPLAEAFGRLKIVGTQTVKSKEADKAKFQEDPSAMVMTVAVEAGGTGHTLTAARYGVLVEFTWTPGGRNQMRDRFNRIGQEREMFFHTLIAENTIDEYMNEVLTTKQKRLDAVLDGKSSEGVEMDDESMASEVAWNLAMRSFGGRA
jgi:SNF2 family DNA or RNA helicase